MLRVLTLSTLFPDASRPNFGVFVERQTLGLAAHPDVMATVISPIGLPPWPLSRRARHASLATLPLHESWKGLDTYRPRFPICPGTKGRFHVRALVRSLIPVLESLRRTFPFDVIDAEFFFPDGPAAVALGLHFGVPVSIKARGADIHYWGRARATGLQVRAAGQAADGLLAVSAAMRDDMTAMGMPGDRIRVHHTGVELDRFLPGNRPLAKARLRVEGPLVVSVGALIPRKGHEVVIDAVASLSTGTLLIAGEGPNRAKLEARIARSGATGRIRLLGSVPHAELPALLGAADVMALASASEGLANAWVEALACGTPIVITDVGGAREVVKDASYGTIATRNAASFAKAIGALLADPPLPQITRRGAETFTWVNNTTRLVDHLTALVGHKSKAG